MTSYHYNLSCHPFIMSCHHFSLLTDSIKAQADASKKDKKKNPEAPPPTAGKHTVPYPHMPSHQNTSTITPPFTPLLTHLHTPSHNNTPSHNTPVHRNIITPSHHNPNTPSFPCRDSSLRSIAERKYPQRRQPRPRPDLPPFMGRRGVWLYI